MVLLVLKEMNNAYIIIFQLSPRVRESSPVQSVSPRNTLRRGKELIKHNK